MEKIEILLAKLNNTITASLGKRIDTLDDLIEKLEASGKEYENNPSDENKDKYNSVIDYVEQIENGIIKDLEALLEKRKSDELAKEESQAPSAPKTNESETTPKSEEKKEGSGVLTLIIGSVLLVASLGAINYFRKQ